MKNFYILKLETYFQYLFYIYFFLQLCDSTCIPCKLVDLLLIFKGNVDVFCSLKNS